MPKTVFIVGAGASSEVGLPVGNQLVSSVSRLLDIFFENGGQARGDPLIYEAIRYQQHKAFATDHKRLLNAARHINASMSLATSIDRFIDDKNDEAIAICGKLAITRAILAAEQGSGLHFHQHRERMDWGPSQAAWFRRLFHLIIDGGCRQEDLAEHFGDIAIICFNYDRCIEHYLFNALITYYGMEAAAASNTMSSLEIIHPYGSVGRLPWQGNGALEGVPFGADVEAAQLAAIAMGIKTFTERQHDESVLRRLRELIGTAENLVFLGFAFDPRNMELLSGDRRDGSVSVYATAIGFSAPACQIIRDRVAEMIGPGGSRHVFPHNDLRCSALMDHYYLHLRR